MPVSRWIIVLLVISAAAPVLAQEAPPSPESPNKEPAGEAAPSKEGDGAADARLRERLARLEERVVQQDRRLEQLESEGEVLRRAVEDQEDRPELPVKLGLYFIESRDGENRLQLFNNIVLHSSFNDSDDYDDSFEVRYLRPILIGRAASWINFMFGFEFGRTSDADLRNAHVTLSPFGPYFRLRVGQMRFPFSMAWPIPFWAILHPERPIVVFDTAFPFQLGATALGSFMDGKLSYAFGVFNGNGANTARDADYDKDLVGRLEVKPVEGLRLAVSAIYSPNNRAQSGPTDVSTVGDDQVTFLDYNNPNNRMAGARLRTSMGAEYIRGPFRVMVDFITDRYEDLALRNAAVSANLRAVAYYIDLSYVLTGENKTRLVTPDQPFFEKGELGTGAIELALRFEDYRADPDALRRGFAVGTDRVMAETVTVNWYLDKGLLASLSYTHTEFDTSVRNSRGRKRHGDNSLIARLLLRF